MIFVRPESGGQVLFAGVLLFLLMLLWMRAAVIIYALFFGLRPFPGLDRIIPMLFTTRGRLGDAAGRQRRRRPVCGLLLCHQRVLHPDAADERTDALTAMGTSMALVWNNLPVMLAWGAIVLVLFVIGLATGLLGLIVVFPVLGHGTWHAYRAIRQES